MQLNKKGLGKKNPRSRYKKIAPALAAASFGLLGAGNTIARGQAGTWDFDIASLLYSESNNRVSAIEPVFSATRNLFTGETFNVKGVFDTLTGASPNGATPSDQAQTFTRPSGSEEYTTAAANRPLDDSFKDTRTALSVNWTAPINRDWEYSTGANFSSEFDYLSLGANGSLKRYFDHKNTALNLGFSFSSDSVKPIGGIPVALSKMAFNPTDFKTTRGKNTDTKTIVDTIVGLTQVINRRTIMQFNIGISASNGYLTDPFKILSVIDDNATGTNYGGNFTNGTPNNIYLYENRPSTRLKSSFYWQTKYAFDGGNTMGTSYRFMSDDWGISSHTIDLHYHWSLSNNSFYLEPHFRYYKQSKANFYKRYLTVTEYNSGNPIFTNASADERLGDMNAITLGMKYGWKMTDDQEVSARLEYYVQSHSGNSGIGKLASQNLYPDNKAVLLQVQYSF